MLGAVNVGHLCRPYLGIRTQHVQDVGVGNVLLTWLVTFVRIAWWRGGKHFWRNAPIVGVVSLALQAPPLPPAPPPILPSTSSSEAGRRSPSPRPFLPSFRGGWRAEKLEGFSRVGSRGVSSTPSRSSVGGGGGMRVLAPGSDCDSAASSFLGVGVAGPCRSQESTVLSRLLCPSLSRLPCLSWARSPIGLSRGWGSSRGRSRSHFSWASWLRDRESREGWCRACSWSAGSRARSHKSRSCSTTRSRSRGWVRSRRVPSCSPSASVRSQRSQSRSSDCSLGRRVLSRSWSRLERLHSSGCRRSGSDHSRSRSNQYRSRDCGTGLSSPLTNLGHESIVGGLGGVAGIMRGLMVPSRIAVPLGHGWGLPLRLWAAPSWGPNLLYMTLPSGSSVCWDHVSSGMWLWALRFRLLPSPVLDRCLDLLHWGL